MSDMLAVVEALPLPESTLNTALTVVGTIAVAAITTLAALAARRRRIPDDEADETRPVVPATPLSTFSGTQNEFMELVVRDNAELRARVDRIDKAQRADAARHSEFRLAVRRYLTRLATDWPGPEAMPWPDDDDLGLLEYTLPRYRPRSRSDAQRKDPL